MLKVQERVAGPVTYLDVKGRIEGEEASALKAVVDGLVARGVGRIALNLEAVTRVDSLGLGTLVLLQRSAAHAGTAVCLVRLTRYVYHLLTVTRLIQCFEHFESDEQVECWAIGTGAPEPAATKLTHREDIRGYTHC
jgi:anti-anti-sigma factor